MPADEFALLKNVFGTEDQPTPPPVPDAQHFPEDVARKYLLPPELLSDEATIDLTLSKELYQEFYNAGGNVVVNMGGQELTFARDQVEVVIANESAFRKSIEHCTEIRDTVKLELRISDVDECHHRWDLVFCIGDQEINIGHTFRAISGGVISKISVPDIRLDLSAVQRVVTLQSLGR